MCWRNFCNFPWWLKNVKSRSNTALFSNECHFEIWFPKKRTITFFWSKSSKLHKKDPILHVATTFSLKQGEIRTRHGPIPHPLSHIFDPFLTGCMPSIQGNCATKGNSVNCQSGNCHSGERWMRKPSVHGGKWKSNEGIDNIANGPVNNMSFFMSDRWYIFKHCGRPNHLSKCAWNLNCHCGRKACSSTSPHYGNCHYGTSHGGIISLYMAGVSPTGKKEDRSTFILFISTNRWIYSRKVYGSFFIPILILSSQLPMKHSSPN